MFIDKDFEAIGSKLHLSIVAPKWKIIGDRKIILDGSKGTAHELVNYWNINGKPGNPGGPAGNFLGIGDKFKNIERLSVFVNGGQGGPGQNGHDGAEGKKGKIDESNCEDVGVDYDNTIIVQCYGSKGTSGENGGNGGAGGYGGYPGQAKFVKLDKLHDFLPKISNSSLSGADGKGGKGGLGGLTGDTLVYNRNRHWYTLWITASYFNKRFIENYFDRAPRGANGIDGNNSQGKQQPEKPLAIQNSANVVNEFKKFLQNNMQDKIKRHYLIDFQRKLDKNAEIKLA